MTTETNQTSEACMCASVLVSYLLGMSMSALHLVQSHLIQDNTKEALKAINDALRMLNPKIEKQLYNHIEKAPEVAHDPA
jgi:hypothetical protein